MQPGGSATRTCTSPPIGFGAWAIGGGGWAFAWGPQDDDESIAAIREALDLGINWIDTAAVYGLGHSEEVVGEALRGRARSGRTSSPSAPACWDETPADRQAPQGATHPARVRGSLRRLKVDVDRPVPDPLARAGRGHRGGLADDGRS